MYIMKRVFAILLSIALLLGTIPAYATTVARGDNDKTVYFSFDFYSYDESTGESGEKITEVAANQQFWAYINFFGNPTVANDSIQVCNLLFDYDNAKISFPYISEKDDAILPGFSMSLAMTSDYMPGVARIVAAAEGGLKNGLRIAASGTLCMILMEAETDLNEQDLKGISFVKSPVTASKEHTYVADGNNPQKLFTVIQTPAIAIGEVEGEIYSDTDADTIKDMISSFSFIDASGNITEYTYSDDEWEDLEIALPEDGLEVGENTLIASYNGFEGEFIVEVLDKIEKIEITTAPDKTEYTAFVVL